MGRPSFPLSLHTQSLRNHSSDIHRAALSARTIARHPVTHRNHAVPISPKELRRADITEISTASSHPAELAISLSVPVGCSQRSRPQSDKVSSPPTEPAHPLFGPSGLLAAPPTAHGQGSSHRTEPGHLFWSQWAALSAPDRTSSRHPVTDGT